MLVRDRMVVAGLIVVLGTGALVVAHAHDISQHESSVTVQSAEGHFLAENETAMTKMMNDMAVRPSGDSDRDFVAMMVPHHQGAIDMAEAELRHGKNEQLRRIAQEIIVDQMQEIAAMRLAAGEPLPPRLTSPTAPGPLVTSASGARPAPNVQGRMQMSPAMNMK